MTQVDYDKLRMYNIFPKAKNLVKPIKEFKLNMKLYSCSPKEASLPPNKEEERNKTEKEQENW